MFDFHEKRRIRAIVFSKPVIVIIFGLTVLSSFSVYERYKVANEMQARLDARIAELHALEERAQLLEAKVDYLQNERGIEEELRIRFDVAKEGEEVVILLDSRRDTKSTEEEVDIQNTKKSFWQLFNFW